VSWGRVDDQLHASAKFAKVHDKRHPVSVWLLVLSWALGDGARKTPGFVPDEIALRFGVPAAFDKLIAAGLWSRVADGFQIHDFADYGERPGRARDAAPVDPSDLTAKRREAGKKGGLARVAKQEAQANEQANAKQVASSKPEANEASCFRAGGARVPVPVPVPVPQPAAVAAAPRKRTLEHEAIDALREELADRIGDIDPDHNGLALQLLSKARLDGVTVDRVAVIRMAARDVAKAKPGNITGLLHAKVLSYRDPEVLARAVAAAEPKSTSIASMLVSSSGKSQTWG
jgi:hypothetical protein